MANLDYYLEPAGLPTRWQRFALRTLRMFGWRVNIAPLPGPHGVVVVYPHTSNWDFIVGLFAKWAYGVRFRWLGKESLFSSPLGSFFRACGGEPIERETSTGAIRRLAERIKAADFYWLALAPEGTRKYRDAWRSGFYHIALTAGVPLGVACLDYRAREVRMVHFLTLSGDIEADLASLRKACEACTGLHPELASPIRFANGAAVRQSEAPSAGV